MTNAFVACAGHMEGLLGVPSNADWAVVATAWGTGRLLTSCVDHPSGDKVIVAYSRAITQQCLHLCYEGAIKVCPSAYMLPLACECFCLYNHGSATRCAATLTDNISDVSETPHCACFVSRALHSTRVLNGHTVCAPWNHSVTYRCGQSCFQTRSAIWLMIVSPLSHTDSKPSNKKLAEPVAWLSAG